MLHGFDGAGETPAGLGCTRGACAYNQLLNTGRRSGSRCPVTDDIHAFVFSQKGLMAGVGLQGNKITRIAAK